MKNFDDTDVIALAVIALAAFLFWLGRDTVAVALVGPVVGFYFSQKQSLKINGQNEGTKPDEEKQPE